MFMMRIALLEKIVPGYFYRLMSKNNELTELSVVTMLLVKEPWSVASSSIGQAMGEFWF